MHKPEYKIEVLAPIAAQIYTTGATIPRSVNLALALLDACTEALQERSTVNTTGIDRPGKFEKVET